MNSSQTELARQIVTAHQTAQPKPIAGDGLSLEEAYAVQSAVVSQLPGTIVGYKSAISSAAAQSVFSLSEPVFGALLSEAEVVSGFDLSTMNTPMIESLLQAQDRHPKLDLLFGTAALDRSRRNIRRPEIY